MGGAQKVVLLVDDDDDERDLLAAALEEEHYRVLRAANGREALSILATEQGKCDLILLDLMMPVMNGWDFRHRQRQDPTLAKIPVLLLSAGARLVAASGDLDAAGCVTKPVDLDDLLDKMKQQGC